VYLQPASEMHTLVLAVLWFVKEGRDRVYLSESSRAAHGHRVVAPAPDALTTQAQKHGTAAAGRQPTLANGQHVCLPHVCLTIGLSRNPQ
jgi:hypothetical protein